LGWLSVNTLVEPNRDRIEFQSEVDQAARLRFISQFRRERMTVPFSVLVIDDDLTMVRTLCDILNGSGFQSDSAPDAQVGLHKLEKAKNQVVIIDIRLNNMNGVEFQHIINECYPGTHVTLMGAHADYDLILRGRAQGALAFLDKPLDIPLLLSILHVVNDGIFGTAKPTRSVDRHGKTT
jgi:DNA-binding NtrC family response regulator